jgi:branched-chain amino acid transport system substrate-binding protein
MHKYAVLLFAGAIAGSVTLGARSGMAADPPYPIHAVLSLTGGAAFLGTQEQQTLLVLERVVNAHGGVRGRPIKFVTHDDGSSPQEALQLTSSLLNAGTPVVIGPSQNATCSAVAPLVASKGPVVYCLSPSIRPTPEGYVYSASVSTRDYMKAIFRYFRLKGAHKVALITSTDSTGQDGVRTVEDTAALPENKSMTLVDRETFAPTDISVSAQMSRIRSFEPDVLIAWTTGSPFQTVTRSFFDAGLTIPFVGGTGNMTFAQMKQLAAFLPKELYFSGRDISRTNAFDPGRCVKRNGRF